MWWQHIDLVFYFDSNQCTAKLFNNHLLADAHGLPMASVTNFGGRYEIQVNDTFVNLDSRKRAAIVFHELGHIVGRHLVRENAGLLSGLDLEYVADRYCFEQGYGQEMIEVLRLFDDRACRKRIKKIKMLNRKQKFSNITSKTLKKIKQWVGCRFC